MNEVRLTTLAFAIVIIPLVGAQEMGVDRLIVDWVYINLTSVRDKLQLLLYKDLKKIFLFIFPRGFLENTPKAKSGAARLSEGVPKGIPLRIYPSGLGGLPHEGLRQEANS